MSIKPNVLDAMRAMPVESGERQSDGMTDRAGWPVTPAAARWADGADVDGTALLQAAFGAVRPRSEWDAPQ